MPIDISLPQCALCLDQFKPYEAIHKMREEKLLAPFPGIPFYVYVHPVCRDEYQHDRDHRPHNIAEQIYPYCRRPWAA